MRAESNRDEMSSFCPLLWTDCYINRTGDVYACCHQKPGLLGNIYQSTLSDILQGNRLSRLRDESLTGSLGCYPACTLLDKSSIEIRGSGIGSALRFRIRRVHVSFGEACNIRCIMCLHPSRHAANPVLLDEEVLARQIEADSVENFVLQGGEPLLLRPCLNFMSYLEGLGKRYTILTNGLLIDGATSDRLALHSSVVSISLNGATKQTHEAVNRGSRFERVLANIRRLRASRARLGPGMVISGRLTITPENLHEVPLFLRTFETIGFDRINFGYVKETVPAFLDSHPDLRTKLFGETSEARSETRSEVVDDLRLRQLGLLDSAASRPAISWPISSSVSAL
jgi:sulfatase maturation enzyme AslB (radical SAM superfamily)